MLTTHWRPVGRETQGTWFVVGDVHGQWKGYKALLETFAAFETSTPRTLVTLGDVIDKGPKSIKCLKATLSDKAKTMANADTHERLWGNHEILMVEAMRALATPTFRDRFNRWRLSSGDSTLNEALKKDSPKKRVKALIDKLGPDHLGQFQHWKGAVQAPGLRFVHAGFCPDVGFATTAKLTPADLWRDTPNGLVKHTQHWASIRHPFLAYRGGWDDLVFHGHSIPKRMFGPALRTSKDLGYALDNRLTHGRVCLDAGAGKSIGVAGAIIHNSKYKLLFFPLNRSG